MSNTRFTLATVALLLMTGSARAQLEPFESFTGGGNAGGWSFGGPSESIPNTGGNPDYYLRSSGLDTTVPLLRCNKDTAFTGNFRQKWFRSASIDVNIFSTDFSIGAFPLTLMLYSDNGTPTNPDDDWAVYKLGDAIPAPGSGWKHFTFDIPLDSGALPAGWGYMPLGPSSPPSANWNAVITNVSRLEFSLGDPTLFYIFQMWTVGADNISLRVAPVCYANCDQSTAPPVLNVNDFMCFLNRWAAADPYANCDHGIDPPILNAYDFQCFLDIYAAGCS